MYLVHTVHILIWLLTQQQQQIESKSQCLF